MSYRYLLVARPINTNVDRVSVRCCEQYDRLLSLCQVTEGLAMSGVKKRETFNSLDIQVTGGVLSLIMHSEGIQAASEYLSGM